MDNGKPVEFRRPPIRLRGVQNQPNAQCRSGDTPHTGVGHSKGFPSHHDPCDNQGPQHGRHRYQTLGANPNGRADRQTHQPVASLVPPILKEDEQAEESHRKNQDLKAMVIWANRSKSKDHPNWTEATKGTHLAAESSGGAWRMQ